MPLATKVRSAFSSKLGNMSCASWAPVTRRSGLVEADQAVVGHVLGDAESGRRGTFTDPGLQHPELAALDRELDVAHVAVVVLEGAP